MTNARRDGLYFLVPGIAALLLIGFALRHSAGWMGDFKGVYYGARCLLDHHDPYNESEFYRAEIGELKPIERHTLGTLSVYLPSTFLSLAPIAMLPSKTATALWAILTDATLSLAAVLLWDVGANYAPVLSGALIGFLIANCAIVVGNGNPAGIVVGLCAIAVWCFLNQRFVAAGVVCLTVSLAIKPHDAGPIWLFFLLAGGIQRRHALRTLAVTAVLCLASVVWVSTVSTHWISELRSNIMAYTAHGGLNDPGPAGWIARDNNSNVVINLQAVLSVFRDDPKIYNPVTYLVCGALLLVWIIATLKSRQPHRLAWFALAAIVPLTMLVTYHRAYDAKLLLLAVPACAMLWAEGGPLGWAALLVNTAAILCTGEISIACVNLFTRNLHLGTAGLEGKLLTVVLFRPASLALLVMAIFNLWVYVRRASGESAGEPPEESTLSPTITTVA